MPAAISSTVAVTSSADEAWFWALSEKVMTVADISVDDDASSSEMFLMFRSAWRRRRMKEMSLIDILPTSSSEIVEVRLKEVDGTDEVWICEKIEGSEEPSQKPLMRFVKEDA